MESHTVYTMQGWGTCWDSQLWTWNCNTSFRKAGSRSNLDQKSWQRHHAHLLPASKEDDSQSLFARKPKGESPCSGFIERGKFWKICKCKRVFSVMKSLQFPIIQKICSANPSNPCVICSGQQPQKMKNVKVDLIINIFLLISCYL